MVLALCLCPLLFAQKSPQEKQLFDELNAARRSAGQPPLEWDERLAQAAREHSHRMAKSNNLAHVLPGEPQVADRLARTGIRFNRSGENVGYNTDFDDITNEWMHSPPHRENMLSPDYTVVGIGVAQSDEGTFYATQDFARAVPQRSTEQATDLVAQSIATLRKQEHRLPLERVDNSSLHDLACGMAKTGKLDPSKLGRLPQVRESLVYNNTLPEQLPESARRILRNESLTRFAVGACFTGDQPNNRGGTFYVAVAFY